ncbi:MAG TPA: GAF and ANTAR domain-containing protein [Frankiaceae bacterium]|nr:GAF and ANTAR domain-containing protein [Frankiaceae bacterium]
MTDQVPTAPEQAADVGLGESLTRMSGVLLSAETIETALELVTSLAAVTLPDTAGAGVTVIDARGQRTRAASDPVVERADAAQYELGEGPCLTASREQRTTHIDDTESDRRWPRWSAAVAPLGIRSMLSVPLTAAGQPVGAIKVYSRSPGRYEEQAEQRMRLFAQQAAILLVNVQSHADAKRLNEGLAEALDDRDIISQAKGVLIAQGAADDGAAFAMLVTASQRTHVKLHDVARQLVAGVIARHASSTTSD